MKAPLYTPYSNAPLWQAVGVFVVVLVIDQLLIALVALTITNGPLDGVSLTFPGNDIERLVQASLIARFLTILPSLFFIWFFVYISDGMTSKVLALRWPQLGWPSWLVIVGFFLLAGFSILFLISKIFSLYFTDYLADGDLEQAVFSLSQIPWGMWLVFGAVGIAAPLIEEMIFRGQIFSALGKTPVGLVGASLITSALWAICHANQTIVALGTLFFLGLLLSWLLLRFNSLWVCIACHSAWNIISVLLLIKGTDLSWL